MNYLQRVAVSAGRMTPTAAPPAHPPPFLPIAAGVVVPDAPAMTVPATTAVPAMTAMPAMTAVRTMTSVPAMTAVPSEREPHDESSAAVPERAVRRSGVEPTERVVAPRALRSPVRTGTAMPPGSRVNEAAVSAGAEQSVAASSVSVHMPSPAGTAMPSESRVNEAAERAGAEHSIAASAPRAQMSSRAIESHGSDAPAIPSDVPRRSDAAPQLPSQQTFEPAGLVAPPIASEGQPAHERPSAVPSPAPLVTTASDSRAAHEAAPAATAKGSEPVPVPHPPLPPPLPAVQRVTPERPALSIGRVDVVIENTAPAPVYAEREPAHAAPRAATPVLDRFRLRA